MTATTLLKSWEEVPNSGVKSVLFLLPDTTDATNDIDITLADYGIHPTGLLSVEGWVHTTNGSVITTELNTSSVSSGVLTVVIGAGTDNDARVIRITGRSTKGVFA